ncbi:MAG: ADP-ribosylglycohydrolase family protein [Clostridia bacterium]|nr:ADP-ribosylglycohydrolase family protein [Clostridia bacterium]
MANYEDNRIRCSRETARQLMTTEGDGYLAPIDFMKALGRERTASGPWGLSYGWGVLIRETEDGRVDFGFCVRYYPDLEIVNAFISKYHDAEWWFKYGCSEIYHYYWQDGEVVEDVSPITDEESEYLNSLRDRYDEAGDESEHYDMIFTEKEDQSKYVNVHPDPTSDQYREYRELVEDIARRIVDENRFYALKRYDWDWDGAYRHYSTCSGIRSWYLYEYEIEKYFPEYKLSTMSEDVLEAVRKKVFPYDRRLYCAVFGLAIGEALGLPFETKERGTFTCADMRDGAWGSATAMTLATLESLKSAGGKIDPEAIRRSIVNSVFGKPFPPAADGTANGASTRATSCAAARAMSRTTSRMDHGTLRMLTHRGLCSGNEENSCGALTRILPLAFADASDDEIRAAAGVTQPGHDAKEACVIYVGVAKRLLRGEDIRDIIPTLRFPAPFDRLCEIDKLDAAQIRSSDRAVDVLETALWALSHVVRTEGGYRAKFFSTDVPDAINLGGSTSAVGAVTGGLAGIIHELFYTQEEKWLDRLHNKERILDCLWD